MMRTSAFCALRPPTLVNSPVCSTRKRRVCASIGMSPISSRNRVPPCASSNLPMPRAMAPVKAPFSWPNNSLSISSRGIAAMLRATNGLSLRRPKSCRARATSSLPVPDSPLTSAVMSVFTRRPMTRNTSCIAGERPTIGSASSAAAAGTASGWVWVKARSTAATRTSRSNGLGRYSKAPRSLARIAVRMVFCALITMIGRSGRRSLMRGTRSRPLPSGISTSVTTRSPSPASTHCQSVRASDAARTAWPRCARAWLTTRRMERSSSATSMVAFMTRPLLSGCRRSAAAR